MKPLMWETLRTNLRPSSTRLLSALLNAEGGILPHVRHLCIKGTGKSGPILDSDEDDRAKLFIAALPKDRLLSFFSDCSVSHTLFQILLRTQRMLTRCELEVKHDPNGDISQSAYEDCKMWMMPLVTKINHIEAFADIRPEHAYRSFHYHRAMIETIKSLKRLDITAWHHTDARSDHTLDLRLVVPSNPRTPMFTDLTFLQLRGINLAASSHFLHTHANFSMVHTIRLQCCDNFVPFMDALTTSFAVRPNALSTLQIILSPRILEPSETISAIEKFLKAGPTLSDFELDVSRHSMINADCLLPHRDTLRNLVLGTYQRSSPGVYSVSDIKVILKACLKLTNLGINLPTPNLGPVDELAETFRLGSDRYSPFDVESELEAMLVSQDVL